MPDYILDQSWDLEASRLEALEQWSDPFTIDHLSRLGVGAGARCLEVGAGRGSIAAWLADRVGEGGHVLAADLDITLLEQHRRPNLDVVKMDVLTDPLPQAEFDIVHARHVIGHLEGRRLEALERLVATLRPGGLMLIEDNDFVWNQTGAWPSSDPDLGALLLKVWSGLITIMRAGGYDGFWGRAIAETLKLAGLVDVGGEARGTVGGTIGATLSLLTALRFKDFLIDMGAITHDEWDRFEAITSAPDASTIVTSPLLISAWGYAH